MECYEPYETRKQKRYIIEKGNYLLKSSCCDVKSCDLLSTDIQDTKYKCNDLFGRYHEDNLDEKGNILTESLCRQLGEKQNVVYNQFKTFTKRAGRRNKHKISRRKHKKLRKKSIKKKNTPFFI